MASYIIRRLFVTIPTLLAISIIVFSILHMIPGDPITVMFGLDPDPALIAKMKAEYNLDKPVLYQYVLWLKRILCFDLGESIRMGTPVAKLVAERLPRTLALAGLSCIVGVCVALPTGVLAAIKQNSWADIGLTTGALAMVSMPEFWRGILLILAFAVAIPIFPIGGFSPPKLGIGQFLYHILLPCLALGTGLAASTMRILRSSMLEVLRQDYVRVARAKGLAEKIVVYKHALRNALIPVITVVGLQIAYLLGGSIVVERVFSYPGMGQQLLSAISARDYPVVQGQLMAFAVIFAAINLFVDMLYSLVNPRIRYQ